MQREAKFKISEEWGETKRPLGTMGRDGPGKLMSSWSTVVKMPLSEVQLKQWSRVRKMTTCGTPHTGRARGHGPLARHPLPPLFKKY